MEGDFCRLREIVTLKNRYKAGFARAHVFVWPLRSATKETNEGDASHAAQRTQSRTCGPPAGRPPKLAADPPTREAEVRRIRREIAGSTALETHQSLCGDPSNR